MILLDFWLRLLAWLPERESRDWSEQFCGMPPSVFYAVMDVAGGVILERDNGVI